MFKCLTCLKNTLVTMVVTSTSYRIVLKEALNCLKNQTRKCRRENGREVSSFTPIHYKTCTKKTTETKTPGYNRPTRPTEIGYRK